MGYVSIFKPASNPSILVLFKKKMYDGFAELTPIRAHENTVSLLIRSKSEIPLHELQHNCHCFYLLVKCQNFTKMSWVISFVENLSRKLRTINELHICVLFIVSE